MQIEFIVNINGLPPFPACPTLAETLRRLNLLSENSDGIKSESLPSERTLSRHLGLKHQDPRTVYAQSITSKAGQTMVLSISKFVWI